MSETGAGLLIRDGMLLTLDAICEAAERVQAAGEPGWRRSREMERYFAEIYRRASCEPASVPPRVLWPQAWPRSEHANRQAAEDAEAG